ncbi:MAG: hypothetical protein H6576_17640 [Lewinellaceae bacterium]|nr:hypothetical protein [Saprospiraceae bacterium]MCB9345516.1 hypothetical protein [Lewinellaceae bacterium]
MNKKMILVGVAALVGCFVFASFDKKTLAQQKEEIAEAAKAQLDAYRLELETACTDSVNAEATRQYNQWVEEENAKPAVGGKKRVVKKATPTGPKVDPLPETTPPPATTDPKKSKMEGTGNSEEKAAKMSGQSNTDQKKSKMQKANGGN